MVMIKYEIIEKYVDIHPDKIALRDNNDDISWVEFKLYTQLVIDAVKQLDGLQDGDPCLFLSENSMDVVILGAACSTLGIPLQGIDYHLDLVTLKKIIKDINAKHVFLSIELEHLLTGLNEVCQVHSLQRFIEVAKRSSQKISTTPVSNQYFKSYSFTSGTTGIPKIVYRTRSFDKKRFEYLQNRYSFDANDIHLVCLPMYHVSSTGWLRLFLNLGCTAIIQNFNDGYHLCEIIHKHHVSTTIMSPPMLQQILSELEDEPHASGYFSALRFIITGGKNCSVKIKHEAILKLGKIIYEYYGTTETGINTLLDPDEAIQYPGSVGREFEGNDIAILDVNNIKVIAGEVGRIAIHSYMNMDKYLNHPIGLATINEKKYLLTSDYGYKNANGYLFVVQRSNYHPKNIYNFYGIENEILNLNYLSDAYVTESKENKTVSIRVVPKRYYPFSEVQSDIKKISEKFGINNPIIHVSSKLDYTLTGKIKSLSTLPTK